MPARNRNHAARLRLAIGCPSFHQFSPLFQRIAATIGAFGLIAGDMR